MENKPAIAVPGHVAAEQAALVKPGPATVELINMVPLPSNACSWAIFAGKDGTPRARRVVALGNFVIDGASQASGLVLGEGRVLSAEMCTNFVGYCDADAVDLGEWEDRAKAKIEAIEAARAEAKKRAAENKLWTPQQKSEAGNWQ